MSLETLQDEIQRLRLERNQFHAALRRQRNAIIGAIEQAYDDAKQAAINPFLADDGDGPWELQKKIGIAIDFRKKLAIHALKSDTSR